MPARVRDQLHDVAGVFCQGGCGRAIFSSRWQLHYHFSLYLPKNWKMKHVPSQSISFLKRSHGNVKLLGDANRSLVTSSNSLKQWILNKLERRSFWIGLIVRFYLKALIEAHSLIPPQMCLPEAAPVHLWSLQPVCVSWWVCLGWMSDPPWVIFARMLENRKREGTFHSMASSGWDGMPHPLTSWCGVCLWAPKAAVLQRQSLTHTF